MPVINVSGETRHNRELHTGVKSDALIPVLVAVWLDLPSMSTMITNLTPVLVSHPYMARRSSIA